METKTKIFGMPVFSFGFIANGFIAIGFAGRGVITIAQFGYGIIAITQFGFGIISISQFGLGLISIAQGAFGLLFAFGQFALGFIATGLKATGYYSISGSGNLPENLPLLMNQIDANPVPVAIWIASWTIIFLFLRSQRDKFTRKMSIRDLFRSRMKHRDDRIRARAVSNITDQTELLDIVINDPSDIVKMTAVKNITGRDDIDKIAKSTQSQEVAGFVITKINDTGLLYDIARTASLPLVKIGAVDKLATLDPSRLTELACSEDNQKVIQEIVDTIKDRSSMETIIRSAISPHAKIMAIYNLENPDQEFLFGIVKSEKDISVCESAVYQITDIGKLTEIIKGDYHSSVKKAAIEQVEDKQILFDLSKADLPEVIQSAIEHRIDTIRPIYHSLKIEFICPYCSQPVFVNGPIKKSKCQSCLRESAIAAAVWNGIQGAGFGMTRFTSPLNLVLEKTRKTPVCNKCDAPLNTDDIPKGSRKHLKCDSCGALNSTFPVPGWFKWSKNAEQIFCAEEEGVRSPGDEDIKPVAVSCIKCGAPLEITVETPRNASCKYCNTVQYLPDPLWLSLHPVKIKQSWYVRCSFKERN